MLAVRGARVRRRFGSGISTMMVLDDEVAVGASWEFGVDGVGVISGVVGEVGMGL